MKRPLPPLLFLTAVLLAPLAAGGCKRGGAAAAATTTPARPAATGTVTTAENSDPITAVPDQDRYKVTAETTGFFKYSPLQAAGSDFELKKNQRLTMLKRGRGFSQIKTEDNQIGYVGTDDIAQLPPDEIAQENAATLQAAQAAAGAQSSGALPVNNSNVPVTTRSGKKSSAVERSYTIPSAADVNTRLPEPDVKPKATPSPSPAPSFR